MHCFSVITNWENRAALTTSKTMCAKIRLYVSIPRYVFYKNMYTFKYQMIYRGVFKFSVLSVLLFCLDACVFIMCV